ncbi:MAG: hypothetical protein ACK5BE_06835 [Alphaproteobacteria bacterium]|jgi:hypothetical protein
MKFLIIIALLFPLIANAYDCQSEKIKLQTKLVQAKKCWVDEECEYLYLGCPLAPKYASKDCYFDYISKNFQHYQLVKKQIAKFNEECVNFNDCVAETCNKPEIKMICLKGECKSLTEGLTEPIPKPNLKLLNEVKN